MEYYVHDLRCQISKNDLSDISMNHLLDWEKIQLKKTNQNLVYIGYHKITESEHYNRLSCVSFQPIMWHLNVTHQVLIRLSALSSMETIWTLEISPINCHFATSITQFWVYQLKTFRISQIYLPHDGF